VTPESSRASKAGCLCGQGQTDTCRGNGELCAALRTALALPAEAGNFSDRLFRLAAESEAKGPRRRQGLPANWTSIRLFEECVFVIRLNERRREIIINVLGFLSY
jgi:hypothetical protein